jgi:hypothetical protein
MDNPHLVIPAKAETQLNGEQLGSRFRQNDERVG